VSPLLCIEVPDGTIFTAIGGLCTTIGALWFWSTKRAEKREDESAARLTAATQVIATNTEVLRDVREHLERRGSTP